MEIPVKKRSVNEDVAQKHIYCDSKAVSAQLPTIKHQNQIKTKESITHHWTYENQMQYKSNNKNENKHKHKTPKNDKREREKEKENGFLVKNPNPSTEWV